MSPQQPPNISQSQPDAHTHVWLGLQSGNQAAERFEANVDVAPSLLFGRYVCWSVALCHTASVEISPEGTENTDFSFLCIFLYFLYLYSIMDLNYSQFRN